MWWSCNTLDGLSSRIFVSNKTEDVDLNAFNRITGLNEWKTFKKNIFHVTAGVSFDRRKFNLNQSGIPISVDVTLKLP